MGTSLNSLAVIFPTCLDPKCVPDPHKDSLAGIKQEMQVIAVIAG